jgi:rhodanese-related sulfurtransferase
MPVRRISPEEARRLMDEEGYAYLDVRSIPEFEAGHPRGAYNVPLLHAAAGGMTPNLDFMAVMEKSFPKDAKLVVGCKSGGRSLQAVTLLAGAGYSNVVDQKAGFEGSGISEPGWRPKQLPVEIEAPADHTYDSLRSKLR